MVKAFNEKQISLKALARFGSVEQTNEQAKSLIYQQKSAWELIRINFDALEFVLTKDFNFGHFKIVTQYNPERIRSSAAKTDAKSISERPCFLCINNLPKEQTGLVFQNNYLILVNPFPIFPFHLTISHKKHTFQQIQPYFIDMLELSRALPDFTIFYNGSKTGASAPDHFHFQAGITGKMPIESEFSLLEKKYSRILLKNNQIKIIAVDDYLRPFIALLSEDTDQISMRFNELYKQLDSDAEAEPMINVLCNYKDGVWRVIVFPRKKQRPSHFYKTGKEQIITGPASVELGGILVLPREEDFKKISKKHIEEIYNEVVIDKVDFRKIGFKPSAMPQPKGCADCAG